MAEQERKKSGGGKLTRSETVTVRLEPKLRYLAEIAGRKHRRTLSSFIEWAIQAQLANVFLDDGRDSSLRPTSVEDVANDLWDVDEEDRFVKLALRFPDLLTHEEQVLWKLIKECGYLWRGNWTGKGDIQDWKWELSESGFVYERLREKWDIFVAVARGEKDRSALPSWPRQRPRVSTDKAGWEEMDDDIPF
ncbi:hypothetical protein ACVCH0_24210 [Burkholderia glumae]|uniref:hypothetical protein n=1 Tax=Burkholderia glumae TaxID=337 RepID=UPI001463618C|nr:hypothetical protein [Burkholderia glumae]QJP72441.1 hypothetical protein HJC54_20175 [Burkholderia glumae]